MRARRAALRTQARSNDMHLQRRGQRRHFFSNAAQSHHQHGCAGDLARPRMLIPHLPHRPPAAKLEAHCRRNAPGQRQHHGDGMLGHHRPMHAGRIGNGNAAGDELRKKKLVDGRRDRVDPPQPRGGAELLG